MPIPVPDVSEKALIRDMEKTQAGFLRNRLVTTIAGLRSVADDLEKISLIYLDDLIATPPVEDGERGPYSGLTQTILAKVFGGVANLHAETMARDAGKADVYRFMSETVEVNGDGL